MVMAHPHFLLFCDTHVSGDSGQGSASYSPGQGAGRWHFVLERLDGPERLEATDAESATSRDRLALLSVVRGLEAIEQPSSVTLVTTSRYVSRGLRYGLTTWREADYTWERFGSQIPIRNADLWRRIDGAMQYHAVTCRLIQSALPEERARAATGAEGHASTGPAAENLAVGNANGLAARTSWDSTSADARNQPVNWWHQASASIRRWSGRIQAKPAFYGT